MLESARTKTTTTTTLTITINTTTYIFSIAGDTSKRFPRVSRLSNDLLYQPVVHLPRLAYPSISLLKFIDYMQERRVAVEKFVLSFFVAQLFSSSCALCLVCLPVISKNINKNNNNNNKTFINGLLKAEEKSYLHVHFGRSSNTIPKLV